MSLFPDNHKFGAILVGVPFLEVPLPLTTASGIQLLPGIDINDEFWTDGLGPWQLEEIRDVGLAIASHAISERPEILDNEQNERLNEAWRFLQALVITGAKSGTTPILLKGHTESGHERLRQFSKGVALLETEGQPYTLVDENRIAEADAVYAGLVSCHTDVNTFRRFRQGIRSMFEALEEHSCDDRVYFFARALEALQATSKGQGRGDFVRKNLCFTGSDAFHEEFFSDLYDIRNNVVHVNDFDDLRKSDEDRKQAEARVVERCRDAEILVKEIYRRILSAPALLTNFETDAAIRAYWASSPRWQPQVTATTILSAREQELGQWHEAKWRRS